MAGALRLLMALMESLLYSWNSSQLDSNKLVLFFPQVGAGQNWRGLESPHLLDWKEGACGAYKLYYVKCRSKSVF
ncbi:hypothetical protein A73_264 [Escherichia phage A73]|uniref:Uncharacterized protein n=1 Tax=Escherichia phage A73 TaxID=3003819 RepID=A0AAE9W0M5_9CAUD|nr:hypothetical protein A73_264 [Escherichia phage A73]